MNSGFTPKQLAEATEHVHSKGKKLYLTCNIVANNADVAKFPAFVREAAEIGVDAVIISDLGLFDIARTQAPDLPIHISTQAGVMNHATANMLCKLGGARVILARELSLEQIREISANTSVELEAFVHGAMCMGFSGRCLISSYLTGRDANRGQCAQPCRWSYSVMEGTREGEFFPVDEDSRGTHIFNSKDLCMIEHVRELAEAGVTTFKIEGRAKTAYYTAVITNAYRVAVDAYEHRREVPDWVLREVGCVSHREYCTGFYFQELPGSAEMQNFKDSGYVRECDFVAVVDGGGEGFLNITQRNFFTGDDYLEVIAPGVPPVRLLISEMYDSRGNPLTVANHALEKLKLKLSASDGEFPPGALIRRVGKGAEL
jgi:putative protease